MKSWFVLFSEARSLLIKVVYDNEVLVSEARPSWGFSCVVDVGEKRVLFDTGWDGSILLHNMRVLGIAPLSIDVIAISHMHWDHMGGLPAMLQLDKRFEVYVPQSFSQNLKREISSRASLHEVGKGPVKIVDGVYSTGELGRGLLEQSLVVESEKGLVVISGCAHPGVGAILERSKELGKVIGLVGGLHGFREFWLLEDLEIIMPCHCTQHKLAIHELFPSKCMKCGVGAEISL